MSIPKIINITDNLLANSITNNGSVEALYHLAFEIYFPRHIDDGDADEPQHTAKELNTTKEVVLSMLLKFIGHFKVRGILKEFQEYLLTNSYHASTPNLDQTNDLHDFGKRIQQFERDPC